MMMKSDHLNSSKIVSGGSGTSRLWNLDDTTFSVGMRSTDPAPPKNDRIFVDELNKIRLSNPGYLKCSV